MEGVTVKNTWWGPIQEAFSGLRLKGLTVPCPLCGKRGIVTSRWIKGPAVKPVYVLHFESNRIQGACELDLEQSKVFRGHVSIFESDIKRLIEKRKPYVLFSGGKDSLATLFYLRGLALQVERRLTALYVDTTAGLPENSKYVKRVCRYLDVSLKIVKPKIDYFTLAKAWGIPSFGYRWCCRELKIKPIEEYFEQVSEPKVVFDGIRAVESNIRKQYLPIWFHPSYKCLSVSPIFYWSDQQVKSFINSNGLPKTLLHSVGSSTECWCGAYKTEDDFRKLYDLNKEMFYKLSKLEGENKNGYTFLFKKGQRLSLGDLEKQILKDRGRET